MTSVTIAPATAVSPVEPGGRSAAPPSAQAGASVSPTGKSGLAYPNPSLRLDSQLGLVVIEFYDSSGSVAQTIPSKQQLAAYQQWAETRHGENPLTGISTSAADPASAPSVPGTSAGAEATKGRGPGQTASPGGTANGGGSAPSTPVPLPALPVVAPVTRSEGAAPPPPGAAPGRTTH